MFNIILNNAHTVGYAGFNFGCDPRLYVLPSQAVPLLPWIKGIWGKARVMAS
jgi:hypothetical protein